MPVVNENDTVAVQELRIGDNDTLSAQVRARGLLLLLRVVLVVVAKARLLQHLGASSFSPTARRPLGPPRRAAAWQVATLIQADWLFLLTDVPNLYTANPSVDPSAQPIYEVPDISRLPVDTTTRGTQWGTGGMATKLTAARIATAAGTRMVICHSR